MIFRIKQSLSRHPVCTGVIIAIIVLFTPHISFSQTGEDNTGIQYEGGLVSVDYKDADINTVLRALAYSASLNIVMAREVTGTVSATLNGLTPAEALEAILLVNGYTFTRQGDVIFVLPGQKIEDIALKTIAVHLKYLETEEAQKLLSKTISSQGDIQVNMATNSLVVTDFKENLEKVKNILSEIDTPPIQVLIEAKIVDIQSKVFENLGATFDLTYDPKGDAAGGGLFNRSTAADESITAGTSLGGPSTTLTGGQMTLTTTLKGVTASATIDALIQNNKAHILASPSIATLNGKEARIIIGERFPVTTTTTTDTVTTSSTEFIDVGTTLRVTPNVSPDGWITMHVHPEVSSVSASLDAGPRITTREADATIRVQDKQTIIIGGLINKKDDRNEGGVPGLKDIPLIGKIFSRRSSDIEETELTVFITPHIISSADETLVQKASGNNEVHLEIEAIGSLNYVDKLWEHISNLDTEGTAQANYKSEEHRVEAMINTYQIIATQFPDSQNADKALFKMGEAYFSTRRFHESRAAFVKILSEYPYSVYVDWSKKYLEQTDQKIKERNDLIQSELSSME